MTLSREAIDPATVSVVHHYAGQFARRQNVLSASPSLLPIRQAALDYLLARGFPNMLAEPWRDSGLPSPLDSFFTPSVDEPTSADLKRADKVLKTSGVANLCPTRLVFINGRLCPALSDEVPDNWTLTSAHTELSSVTPAAADEESNGFTLLNTVFMPGAAVIRAKAGKAAPLLHVIHIGLTAAKHNGAAMVCPRVQISAAAGAGADVVESHLSGDFSGLVNAVTDIALEQDSRLSYYALQPPTSTRGHHCLRSVRVRQKTNSHIRFVMISRGSADGACCDLHVSLSGTGATCEANALHWLSDNHKQSLFLSMRHDSSRTQSRQLVLGLLRDRGSSHFRGRIFIPANVRGIDSGQKNDNLLLSKKARAVSLPILEIYSDDVKCSHGVSVGYPQHDVIFYLQARGLALDEIEHLLTRGFINRLTKQLPEALVHPLAASLLTEVPLLESTGEH